MVNHKSAENSVFMYSNMRTEMATQIMAKIPAMMSRQGFSITPIFSPPFYLLTRFTMFFTFNFNCNSILD